MDRLPRTRLLDHHGGRHFVSEPHLRIQVLPVPGHVPRGGEFFGSYHGELLIHCLRGACTIVTERESCPVTEGDQVLLTEEPFRVEAADGAEGVVQLVWAPGPNPCRTCWEADEKFFRPA
jgi:hypothetical protein